MSVTIVTNNKPRPMLYGYELPKSVGKDFDYIDDDEYAFHDFVEYKGRYYDFAESIVVSDPVMEAAGWHSYVADSYFSGVCFRLVDTETVVVGRYYC